MNMKEWIDNVAKELKKHADRDDCYTCKQLLKFPLLENYLKAKEENL